MEKIEASVLWWLKSKKLQERLLSLSLSTATVFCFLAGIVWLYTIKRSGDPYFILAPGVPWGVPLEQQKGSMSEGFNGTNLIEQQQLNGTGESPRPLGHHVNDEDKSFIQQTGIRGKKAVERFRSRAACLSDAGQWVYDPTPRKLPWLAVKEYKWVNKCDRQHRGGVQGEMADSIALSNGTSGTWSVFTSRNIINRIWAIVSKCPRGALTISFYSATALELKRTVREELKWVWRTNDSSCPWQRMDRNDFCRRIGSNRNVLVVGDSINHEISVAIQNALAMNKSSALTEQKHPGEELCSDVLGGVGKGIAVHFVRNDYVSPVVNSTSLGRTFQDPWMPKLDNGGDNIKILVLNRGAHYQDDKRFVEGLRTTFEVLRDRHPELLVIYRNTPSGHVNCTDYHAPLPRPLKGAPPSFHWESFERQNKLAKKIVDEFHYIYIDVARPIGMRPEGHMHGKDCLHYCQPGPLDFAVEMIYNVLLLLS